MKHRYDRDRKRDRVEIAYMFRHELATVEHLDLSAGAALARDRIRPLLPYHEKTNDIDIYLSMRRAVKTIIADDLGKRREQKV